MIWAVVIGLIILFTGLFFLVVDTEAPENPKEIIQQSLHYLTKTEGIMKVTVEENPLRVIVVYDSSDTKDFKKILRYAALKLRSKLKGKRVTLSLTKKEGGDIEFTCTND